LQDYPARLELVALANARQMRYPAMIRPEIRKPSAGPVPGATAMIRDIDAVTEANRLAWDASAARHRASPEWKRQLAGFADASFSTVDPVIVSVLARPWRLTAPARSRLGATTDARPFQCWRWARERLWELTSRNPLSRLRSNSGRSPRTSRNCGSYAPMSMRCRKRLLAGFDLALITIGVLNWMPDLGRFLTVAASLLAPGGRLVIYETHPVLDMFEPHADAPHLPQYSYFRTEPFITDQEIVYDGSQTGAAPPSYWYFHTMGDIVTGCVKAGLQIAELVEYPHSNREVDYEIYVGRQAQLPLCYSLVAVKS
jgi:hypothetical protein